MHKRTMVAAFLALSLFALATSAGAADEPSREAPAPVADRGNDSWLAADLASVVADSPNQLVTVRVDMIADGPGRSSVAAAGGTVLDARNRTLKVELPARALAALADAPGVASVRPLKTPDALAVTSQGVASSGADDWHALGLKGDGTRVAVVDLGFQGWQAAQADGELPVSANLITVDLCSKTSFELQGPHGTAVAEIVHDVAPEATIYLICVDDEFALENAVDYMIANDIDIVNHSVGWFLSDRGDGSSTVDGSPSNAVRRADEAGLLWINAAGNYAQDHWKGAWNPKPFADAGNLQIFGPTSSGDFDLDVVVPPGGYLSVWLKWDNWPTTSVDLDLYLWDALNNRLASSEFEQSGPQAPGEFLVWQNEGPSSRTVYIEVREYELSVGTPGELDLLIFGDIDLLLEYPVPAGSIADPAFSPHAVAVGASCFADDLIEGFSSIGPTIDGRIKPDFTAADAVVTKTYGGTEGTACNGFFGTSAAAPHVAGMAALVKQAAPFWSNDKVVTTLEAFSRDLGAAGKDNVFGSGDVVLGAVPTEDCGALSAPVTGIAGPGVVTGSLDGSPVEQGSYLSENADGSFSICIATGATMSVGAAVVSTTANLGTETNGAAAVAVAFVDTADFVLGDRSPAWCVAIDGTSYRRCAIVIN